AARRLIRSCRGRTDNQKYRTLFGLDASRTSKSTCYRAENRVYFFLLFLPGVVFSTAKSSNFFPSLIAATSHRGFAPRPAQVLPALSRYLGGTFFPFSVDPPRPLLGAMSPPNLANWLRS